MAKTNCYNCGNEIDSSKSTKEHIPARSLFEGYDEAYKVNRITVDACLKCNGQYSPTDEEFRNMIGIIAKRKENNKISEKSVRSILRKDKDNTRLHFEGFDKVSGVTFSKGSIEDFHKKNFKGLFKYQYNKVLLDNYGLWVNIDENDWSKPTLAMLGFLEMFEWKCSGHVEIFKYKLQPFRLHIENPLKKDLIPESDESFYLCLMAYNEEHAALVLAYNKVAIRKMVS